MRHRRRQPIGVPYDRGALTNITEVTPDLVTGVHIAVCYMNETQSGGKGGGTIPPPRAAESARVFSTPLLTAIKIWYSSLRSELKKVFVRDECITELHTWA